MSTGQIKAGNFNTLRGEQTKAVSGPISQLASALPTAIKALIYFRENQDANFDAELVEITREKLTPVVANAKEVYELIGDFVAAFEDPNADLETIKARVDYIYAEYSRSLVG